MSHPHLRSALLSLLTTVCFASSATASPAAKLTETQRKEIAAFAMKAMGHSITAAQFKKVPTNKETVELVATGLNLNSHLCATVVEIRPLKVRGGYEVTCIVNRGGSAKKSYAVDTSAGKADPI